MHERQQEINDIIREYPNVYGFTIRLAAIVTLLVCMGVFLFSDMIGYIRDILFNLVFLFLTYTVVEWLIKRQETRLKTAQTINQLLIQLRNRGNDPSQVALDVLRNQNWLYDGSLTGSYLNELKWPNIYLGGAKLALIQLANADLKEANFEHAVLYGAFLSHTNLSSANLYRTNLGKAIMKCAILDNAQMQNAFLQSSDLSYSKLTNANLSGADLTNANLISVEGFHYVIYDEKTVWPNGEKYAFGNADIGRFADPNHPHFWEPEWVKTERERLLKKIR